MVVTSHEQNQRRYWRRIRVRARGDSYRTALHDDQFEQTNPALVLSEIRRGPTGRIDAGIARPSRKVRLP